MHAEITNTPLPNTSLNPCRMCSLLVTRQKQKHSKKYLRKFLKLDQDGNPKSNPVQVWKKVIEVLYNLFDIGFYSTLQEYKRMAKFYGIKDHIKKIFVASKKNALVQAKVKQLLREDSTHLFNPSLKLEVISWFVFVSILIQECSFFF